MWKEIPFYLGWILVIIGAIICGFSASMIWVTMGCYVNEIAGNNSESSRSDRKTELNGIFYSIFFSSQIIGNVLTTLVLGLIGTKIYFMVLTGIGCNTYFT